MTAGFEQLKRTAGEVARRLPIRRLFWASLLLLHGMALPSLWSALGGEAGPSVQLSVLTRFAGLSVSAGFFLLKILDVAWLRLRPGWRSGVAAVAVVAVLHAGVLDRAISGDYQLDPGHLGVVFFIGTLWQADAIRRGLRLALSVLPPARLSRARRSSCCLGLSWQRVFQPFELVRVSSSTGPRAPPVC